MPSEIAWKQYFDVLKNVVCVYIVARQLLKLKRHVLARGLTGSVYEVYAAMQQVRSLSVLRISDELNNSCFSVPSNSPSASPPCRRRSEPRWTRRSLTLRTSSSRRALMLLGT